MTASRIGAALSIAAACAMLGCGLPLKDQAGEIANTCTSDAQCGQGAACVPVGDSRACVSTTASLSHVLLEVRPSPTSNYAPNTSYVFDLTSEKIALTGTKAGGYIVDLNRKLPQVVSITNGRVFVSADATSQYHCVAEEQPNATDPTLNTTAAKIQLTPVSPYPALVKDAYAAETTFVHGTDGDRYAYSMDLPPGEYDLYITPELPPDPVPSSLQGCMDLAPPPFLTRVTIQHDVDVNVTLAPPKTLTGTLAVPTDTGSLEKWTLDLLDPAQGRPISTTRTFGAAHTDSTGQLVVDLYDASDPNNRIDFYPPSDGQAPILRLRPPATQNGPVVYWQLDSVDIVNGATDVQLTLADLQLKPVQPGTEGAIVGRVISAVDGNPIIASVTFLSKTLTGSAAQNASYKVTTQSGADGYFPVELIPGTYRVAARPTLDDANAMVVESDQEWRIDASTACCGRTIALPRKTQLVGSASTPNDQALSLASVRATPSITPSALFLTTQLSADFLPRDTTDLASSDGSFSLGVDSGTFDVSIRPPASSNLAWVVVPRLTVPVNTGSVELGALTDAFPVIVEGTLTAPDGTAVTSAVLRAWIPLPNATSSQQGPIAVVPIGEATSDAAGKYVLALPSNIGMPPAPTSGASQ